MIVGGLFLLYTASEEIHTAVDGYLEEKVNNIESKLTGIGMVKELRVMFAAVIISAGIMLFACDPTAAFIHKHPAF